MLRAVGCVFMLLGALGLISGALNLFGGQSNAYDIGFIMGNLVITVLFFWVGVQFLTRASSKRYAEAGPK